MLAATSARNKAQSLNFPRFCSSSGQAPATLHGMRLAALLAELRVFRIAK